MCCFEDDAHASLTDASLQRILPDAVHLVPRGLALPASYLGGADAKLSGQDLGTGDLQARALPVVGNFEDANQCLPLQFPGLDSAESDENVRRIHDSGERRERRTPQGG